MYISMSMIASFVLAAALSPNFRSVESRTYIRSLRGTAASTQSLSVQTKEEREQDFLCWVARIGSINHSTTVQSDLFAGAAIANIITFGKKGTADYTTVQAAVNAVPSQSTQRIIIKVAPGVYK